MEWTQIFIPLVCSFALTIVIMPLFIGYFLIKKQGQVTREEGPTWHNSKTGTPTMGGVIFLLASIITALMVGIWQKEVTPSLLILLFTIILYGLLGFLDDFIKIVKKRNLGLTSTKKMIGQIAGAIIFYFVFLKEGYPNTLNFFGRIEIPFGYFYGLFIIFLLVGFSNAINLTDGIDGLVAGLATISFSAYAIIAWKQAQFDVFIVCISIIGGLVGFIPYNKKPAKIFMGDVGSLALGGVLAAIAIMLKQEWTLLLIGFVYICETLSVILQVSSYKLTGKRIFKMSPIHHHFEMCGWSEWKIDIIFWLINLIGSGLALWILF